MFQGFFSVPIEARYSPPERSIKRKGLYLAEAATVEDVRRRAHEVREGILAAGGADFFTAYLTARGYTTKGFKLFEGIKNDQTLIVLGSTCKNPLTDYDYIKRQDIVESNIPPILFFREAPKQWIEKLIRIYNRHNSLILCVNHPPKKGREYALSLREGMSKAVVALLSERIPQELIIEGGATAFSILKRSGWNIFNVQCEVVPGVIRIAPVENKKITITLKPGSYSWGNLFQ